MTTLTDHPWLRRDTLFAATEGGVLISNASMGFEISGRGAYELFRALHPLFDGSLTLQEIRDSVPDDTWALINRFIKPLVEHGFLRWIPASDYRVLEDDTRATYRDQIAFLAQFDDRPHQAFSNFHNARVLAVGGTPLIGSLVDNLRDNGALSVTHLEARSAAGAASQCGRYDLVVLGPDSLSRLDEEWQEDVPVMALCTAAERLWALSTAWNRSDASWRDAARALGTGLGGATWEKSLSSARAGVALWTTATSSESVQRLFGALVAYEIFKGLTGAIEAETSTSAIAFDCLMGETSTHRILPYLAFDGLPMGSAPTGLTLERGAFPEMVPPCLDQGDSRAAEYEVDWASLVDEYTLPAAQFDDLELEQVPVKVSRLLTPQGIVRSASAWTTADARIDAIAHAYAAHVERQLDGADEQAAVGVDTRPVEAARRAVQSLATRMVQDRRLAGQPVPLCSTGRLGKFIADLGGARIRFVDLGLMGPFSIAAAWDAENPGAMCVAADATREAAQCRAAIDLLGFMQIADESEGIRGAGVFVDAAWAEGEVPCPEELDHGVGQAPAIEVAFRGVEWPSHGGAGLTVVLASCPSRLEPLDERPGLAGVRGR